MSQQRTDLTNNPVVTGTIDWPTIKNTRVTFFDLMDHLKQGLPPQFVAHWYCLTAEEMDAVMHFLTKHETEIERSYAAANTRAAAQHHYWEEKNRHLLARDLNQLPPPPDADARWFTLRDKLLAARKKLAEKPYGTDEAAHRP